MTSPLCPASFGYNGLVVLVLSLRDKGTDDERYTERDENAFDEKNGVVTPTEDREADDDAPNVDFAEKGSGPVRLNDRGGDSRSEDWNEARDFGAIGDVGLAEFSG